MKRCKFENVAVCKSIDERDVFRHIFRKLHPPIQICDKASYEITNHLGRSFIIDNLYDIECAENKECSIIDLFTGMPIFLNKDNFSVVCPLKGDKCECSKEEVVLEYKPK